VQCAPGGEDPNCSDSLFSDGFTPTHLTVRPRTFLFSFLGVKPLYPSISAFTSTRRSAPKCPLVKPDWCIFRSLLQNLTHFPYELIHQSYFCV
jgi:hypothetical protein